MIRALRKKFIFINLILVGIVLAVVFVILVGSNAQNLKNQSIGAMRLALQWEDGRGPPPLEIGVRPPEIVEEDGHKDEGRRFGFIPTFTVVLDEEGRVSAITNGGNLTVSDEALEQAVEGALSSASDTGILNRLGLRFLLETDHAGVTRIAFADRSWEVENLTNLVLTVLLVWVLAMVGFFFVSLLLSSLALRPAERAWEQQRQFVADASHELKTPLTVILANTGIVLSHPSDAVSAQVKWLEYTQEEAKHMKELVDDLLFLAKSDAAHKLVCPMEVSMSDLVLGCLLPFESVAFEAGVDLDSDITPDITVKGDEGQLRRLVMILLDNAVKYAGFRGRVTLHLSRQAEKVRLSVNNTGTPIPPEHLPRLFERFYRADASRERAKGGYGLGLAIAKSIVDAHSGKVSVSSTPQGGTTFTVVLPQK